MRKAFIGMAACAAALATALLSPAAALAAGGSTMWRLYNPNGGEHFYTASTNERANLLRAGWRLEGAGWWAPSSGGSDVYRLYNPNGGDHHYTTSAGERDLLVKAGWHNEGVGWQSDAAQTTAVYRLYNPHAATGAHHYTTSAGERDALVAAGWRAEGVGWYGAKGQNLSLSKDEMVSLLQESTGKEWRYWYYEDFDTNGVSEVFLIAGDDDRSGFGEWQWNTGELWYCSPGGYAYRVASGNDVGNISVGVVSDSDTGYKFVSLKREAGGSQSGGIVYGLRNGRPQKMSFEIDGKVQDGVTYFHNSGGAMVGIGAYWGNGWHQFVDYTFKLDLDSFILRKVHTSDPHG